MFRDSPGSLPLPHATKQCALVHTAVKEVTFWETLLNDIASNNSPPDAKEALAFLPLGKSLTAVRNVMSLKALVQVENVTNSLAAQRSVQGVWGAYLADPTRVGEVRRPVC